MVVNNHNLLINLKASIINLTYANSTNEFVVVNSRDKHLCICIRVTLWCRNVIDDTVKEWLHVFLFIIKVSHSIA